MSETVQKKPAAVRCLYVVNSAQIRICTVLSLAIIALTVACSQKPPADQSTISSKPFTPPTEPYKFDAEDGQWTMPAKNYSSTRFSGLSEINTGNVRNLKVAWTFSTGAVRGHEAAPLVVNNTMYVVTPYPNILYALDLTKGGANAVSVIDTATNAVVATVKAGDGPWGIAIVGF